MQCRLHSRRRTSECLLVTACSMDEYTEEKRREEKRREKNLIVRSGISEAETTNNRRLRSTFCIEATQTRSIARLLCDADSRASCLRNVSNASHTSWRRSSRAVTTLAETTTFTTRPYSTVHREPFRYQRQIYYHIE